MYAEASGSTGIPVEIEEELAEWARLGRKARVWLRDDDAFSDTPHLRRLIALAQDAGTVFALAVIPERVDASLVKLLRSAPVCVWQHGWRHHWELRDEGQQYSQGEFGAGRQLESMMDEAHKGQRALDRWFDADTWQRVFVPPFHALSVPFKMVLPSLGYCGLSSGNPLTPPLHTIAELNADIDIMDWPNRKFVGADTVAKSFVELLRSRRLGAVHTEIPIGLLSHHLAHDEDAWTFLTSFLHYLKTHSAAEFVPADTLFRSSHPNAAGRTESSDGSEPRITVVITSCGRQDLLEKTLDSFLRQNTYPITEFVIIEDGAIDANAGLVEKYREHPFQWLATGNKVGQVAAIDAAYRAVQTEFIFHCEDDWEFTAPGFIEKSLTIMARNPSILQVWLRALNDTNGHPLVDYTLTADGIPYRLLSHNHHAGEYGTWHGFSWNPGLRRLRDYQSLGTFGSLDPHTTRETWRVESDASAFYQQRGFSAAILADHEGKGYVRHIGGGRRVPRDYIARNAAMQTSSSTCSPKGV